jgi:hypothetical protein
MMWEIGEDEVYRVSGEGPTPCPICGLDGGFHDRAVHYALDDVPSWLVKWHGWYRGEAGEAPPGMWYIAWG